MKTSALCAKPLVRCKLDWVCLGFIYKALAANKHNTCHFDSYWIDSSIPFCSDTVYTATLTCLGTLESSAPAGRPGLGKMHGASWAKQGKAAQPGGYP